MDWSVELAGESMDDYYTPHQLQVVARVLTELSNLRAARRIALETDDVGALARMVTGLRQAIGWAMLRELFGWARELAEDPRLVGHPERPGVLAAAAFAAWRQGDLVTADRLVRDGLEIAERPEHRASLTDTMATVHLLENRPAEAARLWLGTTTVPPRRPSCRRPVPSPPPMRATSRPGSAWLARPWIGRWRLGGPIIEAFCLYALGELLMGIDDEEAERLLRSGRRDRPSDGGRLRGRPRARHPRDPLAAARRSRRRPRRLPRPGRAVVAVRELDPGAGPPCATSLPCSPSRASTPPPCLVLTTAAHDPAAPATSDAEGQRLEAVRAELEAELGPAATAGGGHRGQGGPGRDRPPAASGMTARPVPGPCKAEGAGCRP